MFTLYFDGGCEPVNPGGRMTWGWHIEIPKPFVVFESLSGKGTVAPKPSNTNNIAEYTALGFCLKRLNELISGGYVPDRILVRGDSQLVVNQVNGTWQVKAEHLRKYRNRCVELLNLSGVPWKCAWVRRELNEKADSLGRQAYFEAEGSMPPERRKPVRSY